MPEETTTQQGGNEAELSASREQATTHEQETQETHEAPETKGAEPSEHGERSELGRKVAALHRRLDGLESVFGKLEEIDSKLSNYRPPQTEETDDDDVVITKKDLKKTWQELRDQEEKESKKYSDSYLKTLRNLGRGNLELHSEVLGEMEKNPQFNSRRSNDPAIDAELNYSKAMSAVLAKKAKGGEVPFKGKDNPQQTSVTQTNSTKGKTKVELDPVAKEFAEKMGMSEDDIKLALSKPAPAGMVR